MGRVRPPGMSLTNTLAPAAPVPTDRIVLGIALMIGFCITAPLLDTASKLAAATVPVGQITTLRFVIQGALMLPVCLFLGFDLRLRRALWRPVFWRAVFLILSTYCFVAAIRVMPIADALAIAFVEPFILLLLGKLLFAEAVGPRRISAAVVGFGGALLVIQPSFAAFGWVALFPLGTAVFFAFYMLATRSLSRALHPIPMQFHTSVVAALICLPLMGLAGVFAIPTLDPIWPSAIAWLWLFGVGAASALSHLLMSYALRFAPSATLAPLHYFEIVTAVALGVAVFDDLPTPLSFAGIAIITVSGLYVFYRERQVERRQNAA